MDDGELELSNQPLYSCSDLIDLPSSCSMDGIEEFLNKTQACTHAHTCNTSGPDNSHTHTCYHVHTKIMPTQSDDQTPTDDTAESTEKKGKKRPLGNREAVRKYREKKKARTASLEDEVVRLRALNSQLIKRVQGQAVLEAEIARLKCLLVDIRGRIEGEIGSFPYQKPVNTNLQGAYVTNPCNIQCNDELYCLQPGSEGALLNNQFINDCEFDNLQCLGNQNAGQKESSGCGLGNGNGNGISTGNISGMNKKR
ncbi:basic leucine zipper 19-like [Olea europaea var. sylvestris]|uniref:basic leucine zipper 19-like n=1 Tax=Olea europaea var. sylvestris TaxID=158386 RepID=UPI000C1D2F3D|nr:basic leucine zipper 19-like [Olea europaea var. sylvestris]